MHWPSFQQHGSLWLFRKAGSGASLEEGGATVNLSTDVSIKGRGRVLDLASSFIFSEDVLLPEVLGGTVCAS